MNAIKNMKEKEGQKRGVQRAKHKFVIITLLQLCKQTRSWYGGMALKQASQLKSYQPRQEEGGRAKGDGVRPQYIVPISNRSGFNTRCTTLFRFSAAPFSPLPATNEACLRHGKKECILCRIGRCCSCTNVLKEYDEIKGNFANLRICQDVSYELIKTFLLLNAV